MAYSPVYSVPFFYYTTDSEEAEFLVPDGMTAIVREIAVYSELGEESISLGFYPGGDGYRVVFYAGTSYGVNEVAYWTGRVVITEGSLMQLIVSSFGEYSSIYVGGYLLRNVIS